ncbi:Protein saf4 [Dispira simplex]|nr:Protein saf4 [Dispira simplex]
MDRSKGTHNEIPIVDLTRPIRTSTSYSNISFAKLERETRIKKRAEETAAELIRLQKLSNTRNQRDYDNVRSARKRFRAEKVARLNEQRESEALAEKHSLNIRILPATSTDTTTARSVQFGPAPSVRAQKKAVLDSPLFSERQKHSTKAVSASAYLKRAVGVSPGFSRQPFKSMSAPSSPVLNTKQLQRVNSNTFTTPSKQNL